MADLTIATIDLRVRKDTFVDRTRRVQGQDVIAKDNTLMSTKNPLTEKRSIDCQVSFFDAAEEAAFRANALPGVPVAVSGDLIVTPFTGYVTIGDVTYKKWSPAGDILRRWTALHIDQE